jgi:hypothetical protein
MTEYASSLFNYLTGRSNSKYINYQVEYMRKAFRRFKSYYVYSTGPSDCLFMHPTWENFEQYS